MIRAASTLHSGFQRQLVNGAKGLGHVALPNTRANLQADQPFNRTTFSGNQKRFMSSSDSSTDGPKDASFDETMDRLFHEAQRASSGEGENWFLEEAAQAAWEPKWWNLADQAVNSVHFVHDMTGLHYAGSIFATTCAIRLLILPLAIRGQRAASRMAHVQPELQVIKQRYEALGTPTQAEQKAFADQMKSLFARYDVKPFASLAAPLIQAPLFIGMFFGMKKLPELFPSECASGGLLWFMDLTMPDPTYILPLTCGLSFIATIEAGKEQMIDSSPTSGPMMVNAFRAMAFVAVPVMTTFPAAMLCYWVPNNFITLVQSVTLRQPWVKKQLGIWDRPKPIPGMTADVGFQETMTKLVKQVQGEPTSDAGKIKKHNEEIESKKRLAQVSKATKARRRENGNGR